MTQVPVDKLSKGPGTTHLDPKDPAFPMYKVMDILRHPITLRDTMIAPVRTGYIGKDRQPDPKDLPPSGASLYPKVEVIEKMIPSADGPIRCEIYRPPQLKLNAPMMLYAHGGGFMLGASEDTDFMTRKMAVMNQIIVVSVNYRLAPEFPFPIGLDDFFTIYCWMQDHGEEIGGDPRRVVVSGDSSGSNFAGVIPLKAQDVKRATPKAVVLFGPLLDIRFEEYASFNQLAPLGVIYDTAFMGFLRGAYVPQPSSWDHPYVSPIRGDLSHYPPTILLVGTEDPLVDSTRAFAQKMQGTSSDECQLCVYEGMPHGFYFFPGIFPQEDDAYKKIQGFLTKHLKL